jgi:hypothetical protein
MGKKELKAKIKEQDITIDRLKQELKRTRKAFHSLWLKVGFANWSAAGADIPEVD